MRKWVAVFFWIMALQVSAQRIVMPFNDHWKFKLGADSTAFSPGYPDASWRILNLPHDWSIELPFDEHAPATNQGGSLPGGIGWYRKTFQAPASFNHKKVFVEFDGVYRNSEVWINGYYLGKRPNGYISFSYELTDHLRFNADNVLVVRADNSQQPNSRWYSGSGIYRNVRLVAVAGTSVEQHKLFVTTPFINANVATVHLSIPVVNAENKPQSIQLITSIYDEAGKQVAIKMQSTVITEKETELTSNLQLNKPGLWSVEHPYLYTAKIELLRNGKTIDEVKTTLGVRSFYFDATKGFFLNGRPVKIKGVCMHHDLGALGTAVNRSAIERQLRILQEMGCNAIRTSHNPPDPSLLDLCDKMGFLVMDEAFDMWQKKKNKYDYYSDFPQWHKRDLEDQVLRDRNHPSVIMWSIGNEIREQFDSTGIRLTRELASIVKSLDTTRPVTAALSEWDPAKNYLYKSGALDVVGLNYHQEHYAELPQRYPGQKLIASETMSAIESRGHYDMPSDSIRYWPQKSPMKFVEGGNKDFTVSAYDNVAAYWGDTHEHNWKLVKRYDYISGLFVWTGFDYIGEPTPYPWPARSSYFGIVDLAGFPKDVYYMYQAEWTNKPVLHVFPHWNWETGKTVDVWAYYSQADEVELFLNGKSLGTKKKQNDELHVMWRVKFEPGILKAVSRKSGRTILKREISTAGEPAKIELVTDRKIIHHNKQELAFVTVRILDANGHLVPGAANKIRFTIEGPGKIAGVDNGCQSELQSFKGTDCKAFNGLCLAILQSTATQVELHLTARSEGLQSASLSIKVR